MTIKKYGEFQYVECNVCRKKTTRVKIDPKWNEALIETHVEREAREKKWFIDYPPQKEPVHLCAECREKSKPKHSLKVVPKNPFWEGQIDTHKRR